MKRFSPILILPGLFLLVVVFLFIAGERAVHSIESGWDEVSGELRRSAEAGVTSGFVAYQEDLHAGVRQTATALLVALRDRSGRSSLFDIVSGNSFGNSFGPRPDRFTYEFYDSSGILTAWSGPAGPAIAPADLERAPRSFVIRGPIYSTFVVVLPVVLDGRTVGRIAGKTLFTVNHPVNSGLIDDAEYASSFQTIAANAAGRGVEFLVPNRSPASTASLEGRTPNAAGGGGHDGAQSIVPLKGIDGRDVAYVLIGPPVRTEAADAARFFYGRWMNTAVIGLLLSLIGAVWWKFRARSERTAFQIALHGALWGVRFTMLALDVPASFDPWGLFDPSIFASSFGFGAAKSAADMVISALLLAFTVSTFSRISFSHAIPRIASPREEGKRSLFSDAGWLLVAAALPGLVGPLTRGFHAVARSIVFDSKVELNDPAAIYPDLAAAMLLLGAMLLVYSLIQGAVQLFAWARVIAGRSVFGKTTTGAWALVFALGLVGSLLFDALHPNPLGTPLGRLLMTAGAGGLCWVSVKRFAAGGKTVWPGIVLAASLAAVALLIPYLDENIHERDKTLIEAVVRDIARPEDAWMTVLLDRSLTTLSDSVAAAALAPPDPYAPEALDAVEKLAFSAWTRSVLPVEGNTCSVTFIDLEGRVVSHFHVGPAPHWSRQVAMDEMPRSTRITTREARTVDGRTTPWYKGYAPVFGADGRFVGGVWVGIAPADPWRILGQEEDLLTMSQKYGGRTPDRKIIVAEYAGGKLASASSDDLPLGRALPAAAQEAGADGTWLDETIDDAGYETYYYPTNDKTVIGAGLGALDAGWHFYSFSRYILFFGSVLLSCVILYGAARLLPRRGGKFSFRERLVAAFAVVSIIPVVLLATYNRLSLQREAERSTDAFLRSETDLVLNEISGRMGMTVPYELRRFNDEALEEIAGELNTQVHLYDGPFLHGSSRPDLFAAELIDRRVPAEAYSELYLNGRNFQAVEQSVGSVSYLVGYRAVRAQSGEAIGAVAVPSLSRQEVVRTDLARRDVILYGIYILVLAVALIVGTGLAGQIARPVGRLTLAARRVSTGNLDVDLETGRGDELGELETAFKGMTADLRRIQGKMVAVERELAWKEMAKQVAHEIKNPLTPMRLSVQHLVSAYQKGAAGFGDVLKTVSTTVLDQIEALSRIASEFSAFGRFPERRVDRCDVHAVIDEAIALFHGARVRFASAYVPGSPVVMADREELRRAFINIFRNSVQAAGDSEVSIGVTTGREDALLSIAIADNGPGMAPEVLKRLFEPNFSTKTDGMGIGLTIVKKTIEDIDGSIEVDSAPGKGTTVRIRLPFSEPQAKMDEMGKIEGEDA